MFCVYGNSGWYIHGGPLFGGLLLGGSVIEGSTVQGEFQAYTNSQVIMEVRHMSAICMHGIVHKYLRQRQCCHQWLLT